MIKVESEDRLSLAMNQQMFDRNPSRGIRAHCIMYVHTTPIYVLVLYPVQQSLRVLP
jgi:hypothetical protein